MPLNWDNISVRFIRSSRGLWPPGKRLSKAWFRSRLPDFDLWFIWTGKGRLIAPDREISLSPGTCVFLRPGDVYEAVQDSGSRLGVANAHFDLLDSDNERISLGNAFPAIATEVNDPSL